MTDELVCADDRMQTGRRSWITVRIPGCWSAVIHGDDACICPGSANAIALERRGRAMVRLQGIRDRRDRAALTAAGVARLTSAVSVVNPADPLPRGRRHLRVVR